MGWKRGGSDGGLSGLSGLPAVLGKNCIQTNRDNPDVLRHIIKNVSERLLPIIGSRLGCLEAVVVYYESIKRELKIRGIYECRCDERLQTKTKRFTLPYTGLVLELEHLKIETRLISERFANAMGECEN